jgi:O-acetyl-ADP-ribose deacetylase (regulator of RNase III)
MLSRLIIITREVSAAQQLDWALRSCEGVEVRCGEFRDLTSYECIATAGNSFGLMDAGIDLAMVRHFGIELQERIQRVIREEFLGEQPVGTSFLVPSGRAEPPWIAHTPTMRVPMNVAGTDHVYVATWATLIAVNRHNQTQPCIRTLICPAFATGTGGVQPLEAGTQMRLAWEHYKRRPQHLNPSVAQARQERIHYGGAWGFRHPRA